MKKLMLLIALISMVIAGTANAVGTIVSGEITTPTTWTKAGMPYSMSGAVYVRSGASLTVEAGVVVATYKVGPGFQEGTLIVCRGGDLFINGTASEPVIFTSAEDVATWAGSSVTRSGIPATGYPSGYVTMVNTLGDPKTGTWRPVCLEWGSIAILGEGYISSDSYTNNPRTWDEDDDGIPGGSVTTHTNTKCPNAMNKVKMEGTTAAYTGDTRVLFGGDNDNDDSGSISYLSIRYGGKVIIDTDELNGLSLGGVGRGTDIHHVEIMNNVDDGIEIWGGTVNLSYVSIWNIGDDSLDCDEGWRGCAEYGLIVQGYSQVAGQGSGVGDNCFEFDGAEDADAQPVTTARISKFTCVGQPGTSTRAGGDFGTAWRDNARVQYDRCVWMDLDDQLVGFDNHDGDGGAGYDGDDNNSTKYKNNACPDGTLNWNSHWTTSYNTWKTLNGTVGYAFTDGPGAPGTYNPSADPRGCGINFPSLYEQWVSIDQSGKLCQITNSVIMNNSTLNSACFTEYNLLAGLGANVSGNITAPAGSPIKELVRAAVVAVGSLDMFPVTFINPCAANEAAVIGAGGFDACHNWIAGWSAAAAFGMTEGSADLNCDGEVNLSDFVSLSNQWLL